MDRQSERDSGRQWRNWEEETDKELKGERARGLSLRRQYSGRPVEGGEALSSTQRQTEQADGVQRDRAGQSFNAATQEAKGQTISMGGTTAA